MRLCSISAGMRMSRFLSSSRRNARGKEGGVKGKEKKREGEEEGEGEEKGEGEEVK